MQDASVHAQAKSRSLSDWLLTIVLAAAIFGPLIFLANHFYRSLGEPDARDELPEAKAEFSAILAALGKAPGQEFILAKGSGVSISQTLPASEGRSTADAVRMAALANHYHLPMPPANADAQPREGLMLCSDRSLYRKFEMDRREQQIDIRILVSSRPVAGCTLKQ